MRHLRWSTLAGRRKRMDLWEAEQKVMAAAAEVEKLNRYGVDGVCSSWEPFPQKEDDGYQACLATLFVDYDNVRGLDKMITDFDFETSRSEEAGLMDAPHLDEDDSDLRNWCAEEFVANGIFFPAIKLARNAKKNDDVEVVDGVSNEDERSHLPLPSILPRRPYQGNRQNVKTVPVHVPMTAEKEQVFEVTSSSSPSPYRIQTPPATPPPAPMSPPAPTACARGGGGTEYVEGMCSTTFIRNAIKLQRQVSRDNVKFFCPMPQCTKVYTSSTGMTYHALNDHKEHRIHVYECEKCGKVLSSQLGFGEHLRRNTCKMRKRSKQAISKSPKLKEYNIPNPVAAMISLDLDISIVKEEPGIKPMGDDVASPQMDSSVVNIENEPPLELIFNQQQGVKSIAPQPDTSSPKLTSIPKIPNKYSPINIVSVSSKMIKKKRGNTQITKGQSTSEPGVNAAPIDLTQLGEWFEFGNTGILRRWLLPSQISSPSCPQTNQYPVQVKIEPGYPSIPAAAAGVFVGRNENDIQMNMHVPVEVFQVKLEPGLLPAIKMEAQQSGNNNVQQPVGFLTTLIKTEPAEFSYTQLNPMTQNLAVLPSGTSTVTSPSTYSFSNPLMRVLHDHSYTAYRHIGRRHREKNPQEPATSTLWKEITPGNFVKM